MPLQPGAAPSNIHGEGRERKINTDAKSMPPPPIPNPRRTSYQEGSPRSPGILLTHPTFTSATHSERQNTQESLVGAGEPLAGTGEGLAGTDGTVKGLVGGAAPRPNFAPFFTLVNDLGTGTGDGGAGEKTKAKTAHPSNVHYIFADDEETGVLTDALVRSTHAARGELAVDAGGRREREERVIIVDINESGDGVRSVWSANPSWAVLSAEIGNAPTWDGEGEGEADRAMEGKGMMLRIEGVSTASSFAGDGLGGERRASVAGGKRDGAGSGHLGGSGTRSEQGSGVIGEEEMQGLLEGFDRKMAVLRRIVGAGEEMRKNSETEA